MSRVCAVFAHTIGSAQVVSDAEIISAVAAEGVVNRLGDMNAARNAASSKAAIFARRKDAITVDGD